MSVGRLVSGKRHHVLLESFARLRQRIPDALLCIIGGPSFEAAYPERLRAMADALDVGDSSGSPERCRSGRWCAGCRRPTSSRWRPNGKVAATQCWRLWRWAFRSSRRRPATIRSSCATIVNGLHRAGRRRRRTEQSRHRSCHSA